MTRILSTRTSPGSCIFTLYRYAVGTAHIGPRLAFPLTIDQAHGTPTPSPTMVIEPRGPDGRRPNPRAPMACNRPKEMWPQEFLHPPDPVAVGSRYPFLLIIPCPAQLKHIIPSHHSALHRTTWQIRCQFFLPLNQVYPFGLLGFSSVSFCHLRLPSHFCGTPLSSIPPSRLFFLPQSLSSGRASCKNRPRSSQSASWKRFTREKVGGLKPEVGLSAFVEDRETGIGISLLPYKGHL